MYAPFIAYLFLAPAILGLLIFKVYPLLLSATESLYQVSFFGQQAKYFVGLENYRDVFADPTFWQSLKVTLKFNFLIIPIQVALAVALALLLNKKFKGVRVFRSIYLLPAGVSIAIACTLWSLMLNPNSGLLNSLLALVGIPRQPFLTSSSQALWSIILIASWKGVPYWMIFIMAGLQGIPESNYEAAAIDGANALQVLFKITLPLLKRTLLFVVVVNTVSNFLLFVPPYMLTRGGPESSTNLLMYEVFKSGFIYNDMARATTMITLLVILLLGIVAIEFRWLRAEH